MRAARTFVAALLFTALLCAQDGPPAGRKPLKERAAAGDSEAQFTLGKNYEAGRGGLRRDYVEAERWYRLAAQQGDPYAQASLALLLRFGKGVAQDYVQSYMWFTLAIHGTQGPDRESIVELRDALAAKMTPDQIRQASRQALEWKKASPQ
jgi:hypothetical protein